jgi:5'-AMP-activated protein kinase catalytic alpha subunit
MPKAFLNFSITQTIGTGTFGKVKKAQHVPTSEYVAIKLLNKNKILS